MNAVIMQTLLNSKLSIPQSRRLLSRPRLLEKVERCRQDSLLLISASAGFGKTSLLIDFARTAGLELAWYSLDETDRDPAQYCRYLLHAVRKLQSEFGRSFEYLLDQNLNELHNEATLQRLARQFISDLESLAAATPPHEMLLVLDDFQFAESQGVSYFTRHLIGNLPAFFHLIISARYQPQDLMLIRLMARQKISFIGPDDLAFTPEEITRLLTEIYDLPRPASDRLAGQLSELSEGWVTAIVLLLSDRRRLEAPDRPNGQAGFNLTELGFEPLFDYLALETFLQLPQDLQDFLLRTSVLETLNPAICDRVLAASGGESARRLEHLVARNLFTTRRPAEAGVTLYQYHALFQQFLRERLKRNLPLYNEIQRRAAEAMAAEQRYIEAVRHYLAAGDGGRATQLLNQIVEPLYEAGRTRLLEEMLEAIVPYEQGHWPHLVNVRARLLLDQGDNEAARLLFVQAEQIYLEAEMTDYAARAASDQAQLLLRTGRLAEALALSDRLLKDQASLKNSREGQRALGSALLVAGTAAIEQGQSEPAEQNLRAAAPLYQALNDNLRLAVIDGLFGRLYGREGRLVKSSIYYERALNQFIRLGNRSREAYCRMNLASNYYAQGQYQLAESQLNETLEITRELQDRYLRIFVLNTMANIMRDTGRHNKANLYYAEALDLARQGQVRKMELCLLEDQAANLLVEGKPQDARLLAQFCLELCEDYGMRGRKAFSQRNLAWLEFNNRGFKRALAWIDEAAEGFSRAGQRPEYASALLNRAVILLAMGEPRKAMAALTASLALCEELGFEPYLPFELNWAGRLLEYAAGKRVDEQVENFLLRRGFLAAVLETPAAAEPSPPPLRFGRKPGREAEILSEKENRAPAFNGLRASALDGGRVWRGEFEIVRWRNNRSREALFFLLDRQSCSRDELLEALCPDDGLDKANHNLHNILFLLRKTIAPVELKLVSRRYYLQGETRYDVDEFSREVTASLSSTQFNPDQLSRALSLYKRDYLDQFYSNWCQERRHQLEHLYLRGLDKLAYYHQSYENYSLALNYYRLILLKDPYNEAAYRASITCLLAANNKSEALLQYNRCLEMLEELDLKPSPETARLYQKLA